MCGRYTVSTEDEMIEIREILREVNERLAGQEAVAAKTGEIFPTDLAPVLLMEEGKRRARLMKWGFPNMNGSGVIINARQETAAQKPMFRQALQFRRCVVPSTGFFEWTHGPGKKEKHLLSLPGAPALYMAGLWSMFTDTQRRPYAAYVILTTDANDSVSVLHNRMPVILRQPELSAYLSDDAAARELIARTGPALSLEKVG